MKYKFFHYLILISVILTFSCNKKENNQLRPHDPWVFRSVLDGQPRMITLALHNDLWVAYSVENAALYKAWKGLVYFEGTVYNEVHGPQPISIGDGYSVPKFVKPWMIKRGNDTIAANVNYKGHRFINNQVQLMYEIFDNKTKALVYETVDVGKEAELELIRKFEVKGLGSNEQLALKVHENSMLIKDGIKTNGKLNVYTSKENKTDDNRVYYETEGLLILSNGLTDYRVTFLGIPMIKNTNVPGGEVASEKNDEEEIGAQLIAKSDCKTCHNKNLKTVGPSYTMIAEKYGNDENIIRTLIGKIKNGGSSVWGQAAMSAHPDLDENDIRKMVEYILNLDKNNNADKSEAKVFSFTHANIDTTKLLPGAITKVYDAAKEARAIPDFSKLKLKQAGIKNNFDNVDGTEFTDLFEHFALTAEGYIHVQKPGEYTFEIWSDDGSKLYLHDQLVINNDSLHGTQGKFGKIKLDYGFHPFKLEFHQGGGGKYLSLNWIKPGENRAEVIPADNIFHIPNSKDDFSGYSLPMASISRVPGNKSPLISVHPSFDLAQARPQNFEPRVGGLDFKKDGSLIVCTWDAGGSVWKITNAQSGDPSKMKVKKIGFGLAEPLGLKIVDDTIYVMQKQELTKLVDINNDDLIDEYITLCDDWGVTGNFHEFGFGLEYKDDHFYATLATPIEPGGASSKTVSKDRGKVIKVNRFTGKIEFIASGLRTPNGIGIGYNGEIFVADNQGDWLPSSKIVHVTNGAWFGSRSVDFEGTARLKEKQPLVWLPQDEIGNSPSTPTYINVGPYKGQMLHGEVTHGGIKRVFVEEVNGELQGCVFRFTQGMEGGVNRLKWGPDGSLYVGMIGNPGNWGHANAKWYGLQKLTYNNKSTFEMLAVRSKANGLEIEFTEPLADNQGINPSTYEIKQWYYKPTADYGGPKLNEQTLKIKSVTLSEDNKKVFLEIDGIKAGYVVYVHIIDGLISSLGNSIWATEAWYTMNNISKEKGEASKVKELFADNTLTQAEVKNGWELLFDGKSIDKFRNFKKQSIGTSWVINDNSIHLNCIKEGDKWKAVDGGDIITKDQYEDFELSLDWKIINCGNSGIFFNVVEDSKYDYVWRTGPEMQVLDNTCHPDTRFKTHRAGDLYDMIASVYPCQKPAGQWNKAFIRSKKGKVDFYLNGYKTLSFQMHTPEWKAMIAKSKFKDMPDFGLAKKGHISLQDHGDKVWYKNIKIRRI